MLVLHFVVYIHIYALNHSAAKAAGKNQYIYFLSQVFMLFHVVSCCRVVDEGPYSKASTNQRQTFNFPFQGQCEVLIDAEEDTRPFAQRNVCTSMCPCPRMSQMFSVSSHVIRYIAQVARERQRNAKKGSAAQVGQE